MLRHILMALATPTVSAAQDEGRSLGQIKMKSRIEKDLRAIAAQLGDELVSMGATA